MSIMIVVATQAEGTVMIFEKMFETRLFFTDKLIGMGARIILCDPHRAVVTGGARLYGAADLQPRHPRRHGAAARRAVREGQSVIHNVEQIDRGYERIDERLRELGAQIERVSA